MKYFGMLVFLFFGFSAVAQSDFNKTDEKGQKHGLWKGFYTESKRPRYEGTFDHGKEFGTFTFFDDTKAKTVIATREFGKDNSVYTIFYNQKKNKVSEGKEINRLYEGEWKYYHENLPQIMTLEHYKKGKLDGKRTVFYRNEAVAEESNYSNGLKNGPYKKYTEKGVLLEDSNYQNGQFDGPAVYKDPLGNVVAKGNFVNGKKAGIWEFYENGKLVSKDNMNKTKGRKKPNKPKVEPKS